MKERLHTQGRLLLKFRVLDNMITRKRKMTLKTRLYRKKQFTLPLIVATKGLAIRKLRHQIPGQERMLISTIRCTVPLRELQSRKRGLSKKNKELSLERLEATMTDLRNRGSTQKLGLIQVNTLEN